MFLPPPGPSDDKIATTTNSASQRTQTDPFVMDDLAIWAHERLTDGQKPAQILKELTSEGYSTQDAEGIVGTALQDSDYYERRLRARQEGRTISRGFALMMLGVVLTFASKLFCGSMGGFYFLFSGLIVVGFAMAFRTCQIVGAKWAVIEFWSQFSRALRRWFMKARAGCTQHPRRIGISVCLVALGLLFIVYAEVQVRLFLEPRDLLWAFFGCLSIFVGAVLFLATCAASRR